MLEDTRLTAAAAPPVAGLDGDCVTRAWTGPSAVGGGGDACPSVGGGGGHLQQRPPPVVAVGDILQQAIAEVSNDRSGAVFSGEAVTAAALESGVLGIVGSVTPEMLGMGNVKILTTDRLFYSENEAAFSYLMEAESGVERPGISKHLLDCVTADCVQKIDEVEGVRVYPAEFSEPDEGQRLATLIDATGGMVDAVPPEPIAAEDENQTLVENRIEIENGAPKFQPRTPSSKDGAKSAPLGSSQNPIRLVQQGNRYKSLQNLTPEQLAQIMQVVQQQQLIRSSKETGQASVLYNPQTQTKIIFRVVNPSEMQKRATGAARSVKLSAKTGAGTTTVLHGRKKAPYKKKKLRTEPPKEAVQEIRKEIKGRKKALRRRTRYGRLSRPPSYMVSDYKRINRVDFAEDDEDSEGEYGYSDFQGDDSENEKVTKSKNTKSVYINTDNSESGSLKPKKHQCRTCEKNYIGFKGLARHLRLNPSHESGNSSSDFANPNISSGDGREPVTSSARDSSRVDNSNESSDSNPENSRDLTAEDTPVPPERSLGVRTRGRARSSVSQAKTTARSRPDKSSTPDPSHDPPKRKRGRPPATARAKSRQSKLQEVMQPDCL